ncbi:MAG TPA: hypothetical protein PLO23_05575 [Alphaproteobacteria bacterium]|nr:hypothetical protein [Alphaproteobacteria bacterium]
MKKSSLILGVIFAFSALMLHSPRTCAQIADSACDTEYFKSLEARAWLEAQREITQNQNLIYKPDSVLAYTCFDQFANVMANMQSWQGFSETSRWGSVISPLATAMDEALNGLVAPSLISYLSSNFSNAYLGGRGDPSYTPSNISGGAYNCTEMNKIWETAKCYNFQTLPQDGFFTFEEHSLDDKRLLPNACTNPTIWVDKIQQAGLNPLSAPGGWPFDKVQVYYDKLDPAECGNPDNAIPIPTGVKVTSKNTSMPDNYDEKICIMPGCYFDPNAGQCTPSG